MSDIKKTAQAMLVAEYQNLGIEPQACALMAKGHKPGGVHHAAVQAIIAALTPAEGYILVPVQPSIEMLSAAAEARAKGGASYEVWLSMIGACPEVK